MSTPEGPDHPQDGDAPSGQHPDTPYQPAPFPQQPYGSPSYDQGPPQQGYTLQPPDTGQLPPLYPGQQYAGQQYGYPQTAPPQRPSSRTPLLIAAVAIVVFAIAAVVIVAVTKNDDKGKQAQTPPATTSASPPQSSASAPSPTSSPTSSSTSSPSASPSGGSSPTSVDQIRVAPVISGWQGVLSYKENVAYDVPPDWKIETPGTLVGFEDSNGSPVAIMHGVSTYRDEACPKVSGSYRGHTGFKTAGNLAPSSAAPSGLKIFADGVALKDNGSLAPISRTTTKSITVDQGKISATYATATVTLNDKSDCGSPKVVVVAVAFKSSATSTALFIGYVDQGVSDALPLSTLSKIFTTLRPYQK